MRDGREEGRDKRKRAEEGGRKDVKW